jgi:carotenoid 1,2-hydratase
MNVALYQSGADRWAMTERGRGDLVRTQEAITIGRSGMGWEHGALRIAVDEMTAPVPGRLRGAVRLLPEGLAQQTYTLHANGRHHWRPIAPRARIEVAFDSPRVTWSGDAYFDCNWGEEPLEQGFRAWDWSRAHTRNGAAIFYDVEPREGPARTLALRFDRDAAAAPFEPPPRVALPETFWRVPRSTRAMPGATPQIARTLEDAPFYARSALSGMFDGAPADIVHESLSLDRFRMPVVQAMLPFRMPRIARRR